MSGAFHHSMQSSRYELKYIIDEGQAASIRSFLRGYLEPDEHAIPENNFNYPVHSLYCDAPDLPLYYGTIHGLKNRFKLRIRFYDDNPSHPAFFEIKRRIHDVIKKERAMVQRRAAQKFLLGYRPNVTDLAGDRNGKSLAALTNFVTTYLEIGARPCVYVSYLREAYVAADNDNVRLTFDRRLSAGQFDPVSSLMPPLRPWAATVPGVVLELKFTDRYPSWMRELVNNLNLWRCSMAKYVACVDTMDASRAPWRARTMGAVS
jgi:hypothetical protein